MRRLSRTDAELLGRDPQFLSVTLLRFAPRADGTRPSLSDILTHAEGVITQPDVHPVLLIARQRIRGVPGSLARPYWEDDPEFDIRNHIVRHGGESPVPVNKTGALITDAMSRELDPARPLWRVEVVEAFDDGTFGLLVTHHHATADGVSAYIALALIAFQFTPDLPEAVTTSGDWLPEPAAPRRKAIRDALADQIGAVPAAGRRVRQAMREASIGSAAASVARMATYLHNEPPVGSRRPRLDTLEERKAWSLYEYRLSLLDLRLASRVFGVTITDLLLAAVAAAWPSVDPEAGEVWVLVPVNLRAAGAASATNEVGFAIVDVPCGGDLLTTLRAANASSERVKRQEQAQALADLGRLRSRLPRAWQKVHWGRMDRPDITLSNMPGFPFEIYCQGSPLCDALATSSLSATHWGKFTFITLRDVVYGTMIEDSGTDGPGPAFDAAFRDALAQLSHLAATRNLLARQPQLAALSPGDLDELTRLAEDASFAPGETIVAAGERADHFYVIRSGSVSVTVDGALTRTLGHGDSFGEVGIFRGGVRTATVTASEPVDTVRIDQGALVSAFKGDIVNSRPVEAIIDAYVASELSD